MSQPFKTNSTSPWCVPPKDAEAPSCADPVTGEPRRPFGEDDGAAPAPVRPNPGPNRPDLGGFVCLSSREFDTVMNALSQAMAVCDFLIAYGNSPTELESEETPAVLGYLGMDAMKTAELLMSSASQGNPVARFE